MLHVGGTPCAKFGAENKLAVYEEESPDNQYV